MNSNYHKLEDPETTHGGKLIMVQTLSPEQSRDRTKNNQFDKPRQMPMTSIHNNRNRKPGAAGDEEYVPLEGEPVPTTDRVNKIILTPYFQDGRRKRYHANDVETEESEEI